MTPSIFLRILTAGLFMLLVLPARADLPLTVEDLITDKGKFKLDLSVAYANANRSSKGSVLWWFWRRPHGLVI
jgi:hypothetical protein